MTNVAPAKPTGFFERHYFLLRRLHSLSGILPIGVFLINHLLTNSSAAWGALVLREGGEAAAVAPWWVRGGEYFWREVRWINTQVPNLVLIEIALWGAIAFHSILGFYYAFSGSSNTHRYAYQANRRYRLQRISGYLGILFIFYHVATLRWGWTFLIPGGTVWSHEYAASTLALVLRGGTSGITTAGLAVSIAYFLGVTLLVFHFANGLWTAAITWGLTISVPAQRRWGYACAGLGAMLMIMGWVSIFTFATADPAKLREMEQRIGGRHDASGLAELAPRNEPHQ
ncbi:MAG: hypothetical protein KF805_15880 [Phycisphaeraceae bacterium]|nr:hypothetical protein [Phycisphaeraceae bacterium]